MSASQTDTLMMELNKLGMGVAPAAAAPLVEEGYEELESDLLALDGAAEIVEPAEIESLSDEVLEDLDCEIAADDIRKATYAEAEAETGDEVPEIIEGGGAAVAAPRTAAPRKPRAAGTVAAPRVARYGAGGAAGYVASVAGDDDIGPLVEGMPKKVKDKAANLVDHIKKGRPLSVFTATAVMLLQDGKPLINAELVKLYCEQGKRTGGGADGYSIGTARSQAGQMVSLFKKLEIVGSDGFPRPSNWIAQALALPA